jgi:hypothetical protein
MHEITMFFVPLKGLQTKGCKFSSLKQCLDVKWHDVIDFSNENINNQCDFVIEISEYFIYKD